MAEEIVPGPAPEGGVPAPESATDVDGQDANQGPKETAPSFSQADLDKAAKASEAKYSAINARLQKKNAKFQELLDTNNIDTTEIKKADSAADAATRQIETFTKLNEMVKDYPAMADHREAILAESLSENGKGKTPEEVAMKVIGWDGLMQMGAGLAKAADVAAQNSQTGGGGATRPAPKSVANMTDDEVAEEIERRKDG